MMTTEPIYIGSNIASNEGFRHFYLLKCIYNETYNTLSGIPNQYFAVYTSTGANTGGICNLTKRCIIPCFGIATMLDNKDRIQAPILKTDYIQYFKKSSRYSNIRDLFNIESINDENLRSYFGYWGDVSALSEYKTKVGCEFFMKNIIYYSEYIFEHIQTNRCDKMYTNLNFLNKEIGQNNFIGIDLSLELPYYKYLYPYNYRVDLLKDITNQQDFDVLNSNVKDYLNILENVERDKWMNILGSPILKSIRDRLD